MFLSDKDIREAVRTGSIRIDGFDEARLNPVSYDILLGNKFFVTDPHTTPFIDPVNKILPPMKEFNIENDGTFVLHPGFSVLGYSLDFFGSDKYAIELNGKSSLARIGLLVHASAPLINPGHYLNVALELFNLNNVPILLRPRMRVGQLTFSPISTNTERAYKDMGRYVENNIVGCVPEREYAENIEHPRPTAGAASGLGKNIPPQAGPRPLAVADRTENKKSITQIIMQKQSPAKAVGKTHLFKPKNDKINLPKAKKTNFKKGTRGH